MKRALMIGLASLLISGPCFAHLNRHWVKIGTDQDVSMGEKLSNITFYYDLNVAGTPSYKMPDGSTEMTILLDWKNKDHGTSEIAVYDFKCGQHLVSIRDSTDFDQNMAMGPPGAPDPNKAPAE